MEEEDKENAPLSIINMAKNHFPFKKKYSSSSSQKNTNKFSNKNHLVIDFNREEGAMNHKFTFGRRK